MKRTISLLTAIFLVAVPMLAQFPAESTIPKAKRRSRPLEKGPDGPTPHMKDGKVDFSGVWGYAGVTSDLFKDYDVGEVPMTPAANKLFIERQENQGVDDPEARCLPTGVPRRDPYPTKIVQTDNLMVILFEGNIHSYRQIFLNQDHPKDVDPTWYGHSVGHWEGNDVVVVDTVGQNDKHWLDMAGHPASDQIHVVERFSRPNFGTLKQDITITDPVYYTKPVKVTITTPMEKGEIIEYICQENEKDSQHLDNQKRMGISKSSQQ